MWILPLVNSILLYKNIYFNLYKKIIKYNTIKINKQDKIIQQVNLFLKSNLLIHRKGIYVAILESSALDINNKLLKKSLMISEPFNKNGSDLVG